MNEHNIIRGKTTLLFDRLRFRSILLSWVIAFCSFSTAWSQELNATVEVDMSRLSGSSLSYLNDFSNKIESYLNNYTWTDSRFDQHERIDVTFRIILLRVDDNYNFEANLVVNSRRPIYNSLQQTSLLLYNDETWSFNYSPNRSLIHDDLQFDGLTSLLDFYAYVVLGYDFDSFSELGGTSYFNRAQNLVSLAQVSSSPGWSRSSRIPRNRAQLIADLLNPNYRELRRAVYIYHRHGLDQFLDNTEEARQQILNSLEMIREARRKTSNNLLFNTFFNAKYREIVSVFEDAPAETRRQAYQILSELDQSHLSAYENLR